MESKSQTESSIKKQDIQQKLSTKQKLSIKKKNYYIHFERTSMKFRFW